MNLEETFLNAHNEKNEEEDLKTLNELLDFFISLIFKKNLEKNEINYLTQSLNMIFLFNQAIKYSPNVIKVDDATKIKMQFIEKSNELSKEYKDLEEFLNKRFESVQFVSLVDELKATLSENL